MIQNRIDSLKPYFKGIKIADDYKITEFNFKKDWSIPQNEDIEMQQKATKESNNSKEDFLRELKKTGVWKEMKALEDFDAEEYIKSFKLPKLDMKNPLQMFDVLAQKAGLAKQGINVKSEEEALKSLIDLWDKMLDIGNQALQKSDIDITMDNVPKSAKETPMKFFKFFEKRFHKKAEKWKRELYKIGALLLQEKEEALQKNK